MLELTRSTLSASPIFQSVLVAATVLASASVATAEDVATAKDEVCCVVYGSIARPVNSTLTRPTHHLFDTSSEMIGSAMMIEREGDGRPRDTVWADDALRAPVWVAALRRLEQAGTFDDGWNGEGSLRADRAALMGAKALLLDLEQVVSPEMAPKVGLDSDGSPTLSWFRGELMGSLSVFDAETYGYYIERGQRRTAVEEAKLSEPLPHDLIDILSA